MKKLLISTSLVALLATGAFTSCSQEDVAQPNIVKSNEIGLSVAGIQTRTASDPQATTLADNNTVGAFNQSDSEKQGQYKSESNSTLSAVDALTGQPGATVNVVAYAPYNEDWNYGANTFTVSADQSNSTGYVASDLVYAGSTPATVGETTPLTFTHKLAQLKVNFITKGDITLDNAEVTVTNIADRASIDLKTGTVTPATEQGNATIKTLKNTNLESTTTAYAVIVPQTIAVDTKLVKISAGEEEYIATTSTAVNIESGKSYSFTVTVGVDDAELSLGDVTITNWSGNNTSGNNTIEGGQVGADQYASFGTPETGATYENNKFSWTQTGASVPMFEFSASELAQYKSLVMTFSGATRADETNVKVMYHIGTTSKILKEYTTYGTKIIDLTKVEGLNRSEVTKISLAGNSDAGSIMISSSDVYLTKGEASGGDEEPEPTLPIEVELNFPQDTYSAMIGKEFEAPELTVSESEAEQYVKYESSNPLVATVNPETGEVTIVDYGKTIITATLQENEKYTSKSSSSYNLTVTLKMPDSNEYAKSTWDKDTSIFTWWDFDNNSLIYLWDDKFDTKYEVLYFTISNLDGKTSKGLRMVADGVKCEIYDAVTNNRVFEDNSDLINEDGSYYIKAQPYWTKFVEENLIIKFGAGTTSSLTEENAASCKLTDVYFSTEDPSKNN